MPYIRYSIEQCKSVLEDIAPIRGAVNAVSDM